MKFTKIIAAALALLCGSAMLPKATVGAEEEEATHAAG